MDLDFTFIIYKDVNVIIFQVKSSIFVVCTIILMEFRTNLQETKEEIGRLVCILFYYFLLKPISNTFETRSCNIILSGVLNQIRSDIE